jgi:hypothetical protein
VTWDDVVALAKRLPGVEVSTSYGTPALKVAGRFMTRLRTEDDSIVLTDVPADERDFLTAAEPGTFHTTPHYDGYPTVLARLGPADPGTVFRLLERRWRHVAPKKLVKAWDQAQG